MSSRLSFALVLLVGLLAGGLGTLVLRPQAAPVDAGAVRSIITGLLQKHDTDAPRATAELDAGKVDTLIENYLMSDPTILQRMNDKLAERKHVAERQAEKSVIDANATAIYDGEGNVVLGNPKGDVTLVEMFDYNCSYCRGALPDLANLMAGDKNLKVILKEFPILTTGSVDAARVALLVAQNPKINYWDFHQQLFSQRGEVGATQALQVAEQLGGDRVELMLDMNKPALNTIIQQNYNLAKALNTSGTPTYILGDEMIPGALGIDQLKLKIANIRKCGSTECTAGDGVAAS
jgi:protein-disulfide isomerase